MLLPARGRPPSLLGSILDCTCPLEEEIKLSNNIYLKNLSISVLTDFDFFGNSSGAGTAEVELYYSAQGLASDLRF